MENGKFPFFFKLLITIQIKGLSGVSDDIQYQNDKQHGQKHGMRFYYVILIENVKFSKTS